MKLIFATYLLFGHFLTLCECGAWNGGLTIRVSNGFRPECYFLENVKQRFYVSIDYQVRPLEVVFN